MSNQNPKQNTNGGFGQGSKCAILIIDVVTDFEFEDGEALYQNARPMAESLSVLKHRAHAADVPAIYVNDNYGRWQEDFERQVESVSRSSSKGSEIMRKLAPAKDDYYVLKPQRSGFYETPLAVLLSSLGVENLLITGVTTDICVLFTAHDAYMRGYRVLVPADCSAATTHRYHNDALALMKRVADADIRPSIDIDL
jgi:nicotinamidase-related amidase